MERISHNESDTQQLAQQLAAYCQPPLVIYFQGQLGAGKTTLVRALLRALGISGAIKSPTYALLEPYQTESMLIYHFDLYRLVDAEELDYLGIRDYLQDDAICLIEWPEKGKGHLPEADIHCKIDILADARKIILSSNNKKGLAIIDQLGGEKNK